MHWSVLLCLPGLNQETSRTRYLSSLFHCINGELCMNCLNSLDKGIIYILRCCYCPFLHKETLISGLDIKQTKPEKPPEIL